MYAASPRTLRARAAGWILAIGLLASGLACARAPSAPSDERTVTAVGTRQGIVLTNRTDARVGFSISDPDLLALLAACVDPGPACLRLAPQSSLLIPYSEVLGYKAGLRLANVYWWHLVPAEHDAYRIDEIRTIAVPLPANR